MGSLKSLLLGLSVGAGMMYFLDPQNGNRRKALVRDQVIRMQHQGDEAIEVAMRDMRNRVRGVLSQGMSMVNESGGVPDHIMQERVRSRLGFLTRHPGAVQVAVENGTLTLSGDVLEEETDSLVQGLSRIRGIQGVQNNLRVHQTAENIPQLQGEGWMPGEGRGSMLWSPSTRLLAGVGAGYLVLYGMARGGLIGLIARISGLILGARALSNMDMRTMTGTGTEHEAVRVRKSININAPVDQVYELWSNFENFSQFMSNIEEVRDMGDGRSHWVVKGPAGSKVEFDALTTANVPNEVVAWETTPDSQVKHRGQVRFRESEKGTQVNVNMAYTPPAGVAGHAVAKLFGKDPKTEMDADLARMKSLLEEGKTHAGNKEVRRDQVMPVTGERKGRSGSERGSQMTEMRESQDQEEDTFVTGGGAIGEDVPTDFTDEERGRQTDEDRGMSGIGGGPLNTGDL